MNRSPMSRTSAKCKAPGCRNRFERKSMTHRACSPECAAELVRAEKEKQERKGKREEAAKTKAKRETLKTRSDWIKEAQIAANSYVRLRDRGRVCISCSVTLEPGSGTGGNYDCGHLFSRGAYPNLRFELDNMFGQCKRCNRYLAGNHSAMRAGAVERIGRERVEALEADQTPRKWTIDELKAIRDKYRAMMKDLKRDGN